MSLLIWKGFPCCFQFGLIKVEPSKNQFLGFMFAKSNLCFFSIRLRNGVMSSPFSLERQYWLLALTAFDTSVRRWLELNRDSRLFRISAYTHRKISISKRAVLRLENAS